MFHKLLMQLKKKLDLSAISFFLPSIKSNCFVYLINRTVSRKKYTLLKLQKYQFFHDLCNIQILL